MDLKNGVIKIDDEVFKPGYTFKDFCSSLFYKDQDGIRIIYLDGKKVIDDHGFFVSLFFRAGKLYMISLVCCDNEFTPEAEYERKKLHDIILSKYSVHGERVFSWGKVSSKYDRRSNTSSINLVYSTGDHYLEQQ